MAAAELNMTLERGSTFSFSFEYVDSENEPVSLASAHIAMQARKSQQASSAAIITATNGEDGLWVVEAGEDTDVLNKARLRLSPEDTREYPIASLFYDVEVTLNPSADDPDVQRIIYGRINITPEVTRV